MKTKVRVKLQAECWVKIETTHGEDESPTDLLPREEREAISLAEEPRWHVEKVEVIK